MEDPIILVVLALSGLIVAERVFINAKQVLAQLYAEERPIVEQLVQDVKSGNIAGAVADTQAAVKLAEVVVEKA